MGAAADSPRLAVSLAERVFATRSQAFAARARRDLLLQPRGVARRQGITANSRGKHAGSEFFDLILVTTKRATTN